MTAKIASPTIMASPVLSSTVSSVASADSPVFSNRSIHSSQHQSSAMTFAEINKREQQDFAQKRNFSYMNDDTISVISHDDDDHSFNSDDSCGKKPGRKPMAEEECDDDDEDPKIKRKAQNRAAQRAFRERKERYVKELEKKIKYVQDSHIYATTQLFQENQHLRSIIYRLELELGNLKGMPIDMSSSHLDDSSSTKSWLYSVGPPPAMNAFHPPSPHLTSLAPLQIRLSPIVSKPRKIVPNIPERKKQKKHHDESTTDTTSTASEIEIKQSKNSVTAPSSPSVASTDSSNSGQQFTFSITTPATLRASSNNELVRKNEQIQAVQLYPDHSHPANCLLEKKQTTDNTLVLSPTIQYTSSIASSVISSSSCEDEEEKNTIVGIDDDQEFNDILKPFLDTRGNFDFSAFNQDSNTTDASPGLILNQLLEEASQNNNDNTDWNIMETF